MAGEYATLEELREQLDIPDDSQDAKLARALAAASRAVDQHCGRRPGGFAVPTADETRYFTAEDGNVLWVGELLSVTTLATDEDGDRVYECTWGLTDYDLEPYNAALDGVPYRRIATTPNGTYSFPVSVQKGVKIIGRWGWPTVPAAVVEATLLQAARLFRRKEAPFGVVGAPDIGQAVALGRLDPDVATLLRDLRAIEVRAV